MKITNNNLNKVPKREQILLKSLLEEINELNTITKDVYSIHWQDYHNEYSPERVDPCPDFYGGYEIRKNDKCVMYEVVDLTTLDYYLFFLQKVLIDNDEY